MEHVGIYAKLRAIYWTNGCRLPEEDNVLKRKLPGVDDVALKEVLAEFFPDDHNGYLDERRAETEAVSQKASANARQRWNKGKTETKETPPGNDGEDF